MLFSLILYIYKSCFKHQWEGWNLKNIIIFLVRTNLPLFSTVVPSTTVENKVKLILTEVFPSVQKHDI